MNGTASVDFCKRIRTGDKGQRFEVRAKGILGDPEVESVFGWAETLIAAEVMVRSVNFHPVWHSPRIVDRLKPYSSDPTVIENDA